MDFPVPIRLWTQKLTKSVRFWSQILTLWVSFWESETDRICQVLGQEILGPKSYGLVTGAKNLQYAREILYVANTCSEKLCTCRWGNEPPHQAHRDRERGPPLA